MLQNSTEQGIFTPPDFPAANGKKKSMIPAIFRLPSAPERSQ
jgi:hypothetical protein